MSAPAWPPENSTSEDVVAALDLGGRFFVITGANCGLGLETARVILSRGAQVVFACRNVEKADKAVEDITKEQPAAKAVVMHLDLNDMLSVRKFADEYKSKGWPLHCLMLNASALDPPNRLSAQGIDAMFQANHLAQMYLALELKDVLEASAPSRLIPVSSLAHKMAALKKLEDFEEAKLSPHNGGRGLRHYMNTKLCNALFTREWDRRFGASGVHAFTLNPKGHNSGSGPAFINCLFCVFACCMAGGVEKAAACHAFVATTDGLDEYGGRFFDKCRPTDASDAAQNDEFAFKLWETSENMIERLTKTD